MTEIKEEGIRKNEPMAIELLSMLKEQNQRLASALKICIVSFVGTIITIVIAFLVYLYQYDFTATIEQTGVYTFSDSAGNVISADISPEEMTKILEVINGKNKNNNSQD